MFVLQSLVIGVITAFLVWYLNFRWNRKHFYKLAEDIPGSNWFIYQMAFKILRFDSKDIFKIVDTEISKLTTPFKCWIGTMLMVIVDLPEDLQILLNSPDCTDKSSLYKVVPLQKGLLIAGGELWKTHRKLLNPSFYVNVLQSFTPLFNQKAKILVKVLKKYESQGQFNIYRPLSACTLETLLATSIGIDQDIQNDLENETLLSMEKRCEVIGDRIFNIWLQLIPLYKLKRIFKTKKIAGCTKMTEDILKVKYEQCAGEEAENEFEDFGYRKPQIFIDQLLRMRGVFNREEIRDEVNTIITAGHETTALAISSTLLMLAMHQDVQEKVITEMQNLFETKDEDVSTDLLPELTYLEMVIKENLRLLPILTFMGRLAEKDIQLTNIVIPAGANIMVHMFKVHRNPLYWGEDAHLFNPERFTPENIAKIHPYAFIPFANGPRICIGKRYAMNNIKIVLCHFLRNFKVTTNLKYDELEFRNNITMRVAQGYMIKLEKRAFKQ